MTMTTSDDMKQKTRCVVVSVRRHVLPAHNLLGGESVSVSAAEHALVGLPTTCHGCAVALGLARVTVRP